MAGLLCTASFTGISLSAATAKSVVMLTAPTNQRLVIKRIRIKTSSTSSTEAPIDLAVKIATTAGTFTAATPVKVMTGLDETVQATYGRNCTSEPTKTDTLYQGGFHPQAGLDESFPPGRELVVPGGGRIVFELTAPSSTSVSGMVQYEE